MKAEDAPEGAPQNATVEGAKEYAQWVDQWLKKQIGDEKLIEQVAPLILGENAFGRYVRAGTYKSPADAERMTLVTTVDGRVYIIETIVFKGALVKNRKMVEDGYAVGASLRKPEGGIGGFPAPGEEE